MSQTSNNSNFSSDFPTAMFADCLANSKEIFQLIDEVFPIDSCSHYEVLPLKLTGSNLALGMLNPQNEESLKFVNSIARVFKYNLEIQLIDLQTFQIILDNYSHNSPQPQQKQKQDYQQTVVDSSFEANSFSDFSNPSRKRLDSSPTVVSPLEPIAAPSSPESSDLPPDLDVLKESNFSPESSSKPARVKKDSAATVFEIPPEFLQQQSSNLDEGHPDGTKDPRVHEFDNHSTIISEDPVKLLAEEAIGQDSVADVEAKISELISELAEESTNESDILPKLLPELSWQKLLDRALKHHIEEIILSCNGDLGSVVVNKERLPQSSLKQLSREIFDSLAGEIKQIAKLPSQTLTSPKKIVLERFYEQERILIRLEFMPKTLESEQIRIQILRGQALKIYEQQQMDRVSEQALQLAKQLEKTLRRMQVCFDSAELTNLEQLQGVQSRINHQLRLLDR